MRRARATSCATAAWPTSASSASRPSDRSCSATSARCGCASRRTAPFIHTAFCEGRRAENSILRMREVLDAVLEWIPGWESSATPTRGANAIVNVGALQGGFGWRVSRTPHRTDLFLDVRVPPTMAMARARSEVMRSRALAAGALPRSRRRGRGLRDRAGGRDRRGASADRRDRRGARAGLRRAARARHDALVLGRLGADALRRADGQLRNVERPARPAARREPRHRRTGEDGHGLRADGRRAGLRGGANEAGDVRARRRAHPRRARGRQRPGARPAPTCAPYYEGGMQPTTRASRSRSPVRLRAPIVPKKFLHTAGNFREHEDESKQVDWTHEIAPWIVLLPERGRDRRAGRARDLPRAPDRGARLRARAGGRHGASPASTSGPRRRPTTSAAT